MTRKNALVKSVTAEIVEDAPVLKTTPVVKHELRELQAMTLGNSNGNYCWNDGWDRAICTCGWTSCPIQRNKVALIELFKVHVMVSLR